MEKVIEVKCDSYENIYVISDLHGSYELFNKIYSRLKDNDLLIILGDSCDRGKIDDILKIYNCCIESKNIIHTLGNHEELLLNSFHDIEKGNSFSTSILCWASSGGKEFLEKVFSDEPIENLDKILEYVKNMPLVIKTDKYILSHVGVKDTLFNDNSFILWNRDYELLLDTPQIIGHTPSKEVLKIRDKIFNIDCGAIIYNQLCVFNLKEESYEIIE